MSDTTGGGNELSDFCDYCYRAVPRPDLSIVYTVINGIEKKERVCPDCEREARQHEKPAATDGGAAGSERCPPLREGLIGDEWADAHDMEVVGPWRHNPDEKILERCQRDECEAFRVTDRQGGLSRWSN